MKPPPPTSADAPTIFDGPPGEPRTDPLERIGSYRVEGRLGSGGMGEVFLAWDERLERRVAIKRIRQEAGLSPDQRERFRREARLAGRLNHPAVVQIHDLIPDGPDDAIVMEYVEGRTLADLLQERMEMPVILRLACEIAEGLAAAHEAGLVHRDLKAGNVIVTPTGHAKILDFGLARPVIREQGDPGITRQGIIVGTCHAMSPEQARGEEVDVRSDLFSFGTLVHEMLTGRPPFRGTDPIDTLRKVVTEEPVDPRKARPDLPRDAAHLLRRLLKKNRDERPANAREVVEILERFRAAPSGPHAVGSGRWARKLASGERTLLALPAPFRRPPTWRLALLSGIAVVLLAVALYLPVWSSKMGTGFDVSFADHEVYKSIQMAVDRGDRVNLEVKLERIKDITENNSDFFEAHILGARIARSVFLAKRDWVDLDSAFDFIERAKERAASDDPRPLIEELYLLLAAGELGKAEDVLKTLEELISDRPRLWVLQAQVAEAQNDLKRAAELLERAVAQAPSWRNRYLLSDVYARLNRLEDARKLIEGILQTHPDNGLALEKLGDLELQYGDLDRAEQAYSDLKRLAPSRAWNNLGTVRLLRGHLKKAEGAYNAAIELDPSRFPALINLAEVQWDLGKRTQAKENFKKARDLLEKLEEINLSPSEHLLKAHCLARLGEPQEAVKIAREQLDKNPEDASLQFLSVPIFSLAGDRPSARKSAKEALNGGFQRRWFMGSAFQWLYEDPEVGPLLREDR